jgi:hypothetical protein
MKMFLGWLVVTSLLTLVLCWKSVVALIRDAVTEARYRRMGEKSPKTLRKEAIAELRSKVMSVEEAKERARAYAKSQGRSHIEPFDVNLYFCEDEQRKPGDPLGSFYYSMFLGATRPPTLLQMDAVDGTILLCKSLYPR